MLAVNVDKFRIHKRSMSNNIEPYIDGLKAVGDRKISRDVNKRNLKKSLFSSVIPNDPWQHRCKNSESIRAAKAIETIMKHPQNESILESIKLKKKMSVLNKDLEIKTYDYKVFTSQEKKKSIAENKKRSSSTGKYL